jgi:two-component system, LytTR family, sensor kinase
MSIVLANSRGQTTGCTILAFGCILRRCGCTLGYDSQMDTSHSLRQQWIWVGSIWTAFGLVDGMQTVFMMRAEGMHHAWLYLLAITIVSWLPWALATPAIMRLGERFPPVGFQPWIKLPIHLAACAAVGFIFSAWTVALELLFNPFADITAKTPAANANFAEFVPMWLHKFSNGILPFLILYATTLAVSYALESRARLARQQTETARLNELLSKAQLDALRRQIEPHFLFNTLNAIAGLVRESRNDDAVTMIAGLSDFLRRVLDGSAQQQVPLAEEMEFAQRYLDIQKVRFVDRLTLTVDVPPDLLTARVPVLILQPMVENAIKHGIAKRAQGGAVKIAAARSNGMLTLRVYNDGPGLPANWEQGSPGIGVANTRTRLASLYGDAFEMDLRNQPPDGVEASVSVPYRVGAAPEL